jgi:Bax protein
MFLKHILFIQIVFGFPSLKAQNPEHDPRQIFINRISPLVKQVNQETLMQRNGIYNLFVRYKTLGNISTNEKFIIYRYLIYYRCQIPDDFSAFELTGDHFKQLLVKVDEIPLKLVLAQAALESNWGKSRFAANGHNYFGIRCYSAGCGLEPKAAASGNFMVKTYSYPIDGLRDYFRLLNSSVYYTRFRELRMINRMNGELPKPEEIVYGLENFSSLRQEYIQKLIRIMKSNFD